MSLWKFWRQFTIDQLDFGFWSNVPHYTRGFGFYSRFIRRYGYTHRSCGPSSRHSREKGQVQIKMCDDHGDPFIATLHNVLLAPDLCDRLFSIITLMNSGHTCLFHKRFCTVYLGAKEKNVFSLPHSAQRKHTFLG